jgi:multiple sugar transport system permease protein
MATALLLHTKPYGYKLLRALFLLPWIIPQAQITLLSIWMFNPEYGIINWLLGIKGMLWFDSIAMTTLIIINIYRGFPFTMIMLLAGLQSIPVEVNEAATVDGVSALQRFWFITLPLLRKVLVVLIISTFIWYMPHFMTIWTLTLGGPADKTYTLALAIYDMAFRSYDFGVASAEGSIWLVITLFVCVSLFYIFRDKS